MIRVILCRVGQRPLLAWISADPSGDYIPAIRDYLGGVSACLPLGDGVDVWCNRDGWMFGLALTRRVIGAARAPHRPGAGDEIVASVQPQQWGQFGDFALARSTPDGLLTDLTEADLRHWMFWLTFDHLMGR